MSLLHRRTLLKAGITSIATMLAGRWSPGEQIAGRAKVKRNHRIHQSVSRWCYKNIELTKLCSYAAEIGLEGIDLLQPEEYEIPRRYGLRCTMGYAGGGEIDRGLNRLENHAEIEAGLRKYVPLAAKAGVPNVITFSGLRNGMPDEEGARNTIAGLKRIRSIAEDHGVTICIELLNSKRDHPGYMCDHTAWGAGVLEEVASPNIKLLYDIYHMQIMEGDLITTIRRYAKWIGHYHTGGVPGRHELDATQEIRWDAVMHAIMETGFTGYVAHEFVPTRDPLISLREAVDLCDI